MIHRLLSGSRLAVTLCIAVGVMGVSATSAWAAADSTSTSVSCSPSTLVVNETSTCTATVTDTTNSASPIGQVNFTSTVPANYGSDGAYCTLTPASANTSSCSVSYTPEGGNKSNQVGANYHSGDMTTYTNSNGSEGVPVTTRMTTTTISCSPSPVPVGSPTVCTITVTDTDPNPTAMAPNGIVTVFGGAGDSFPVTGDNCTLTPQTSNSSSCTVSDTPTGPPQTHPLRARYGGNAMDHPSTGHTTIKVIG
jgi:hypothetical protein